MSKAAELAKTAAEKSAQTAEVATLRAKVAAFEKEKEAENLLLSLDIRHSMSPVSVNDFIEKRAQIAKMKDIESAHVAVKMAQTQSFDACIGDPVERNTDDGARPGDAVTRADKDLNDFIFSS